MALHTGIRQARVLCPFSKSLKLCSAPLNHHQISIARRSKHHYKGNEEQGTNGKGNHTNWKDACKLAAAIGLTGFAVQNASPRNDLLAEANIDQEIVDKENRIRQFSQITTIFDYFATYQIVNEKGRKDILMSVSDFYNSVTPGSSLSHGTGTGVYTIVETKDAASSNTYENEKLPMENKEGSSLLNEIQKHGLLTFQDFCFLLNLLSTPRRYMDIAFHCFDVSADGNVEAKEFAHVMASVTNYKGNPNDLLEQTHSGLFNYLFGEDRKKEINREKLHELQQQLMDDVLWLEFTRYSKDNKTISEVDFCHHLLLCANITSKKKRKMINRVKKEGNVGKGITFEAFKCFYNVLFGGADLERAMFFLDTEKNGINSAEFTSIAKWVANSDVDPHMVEVVYALLDEDGDRNLSVKEFSPVLFQWRRSRGFQHQNLQISMGQLQI